MPANRAHVEIYCQGTFDYANPTNQQIDQMAAAATDLSTSGFGTVILGQWHVHADGSIYYNDSPVESVIQQLKVIPTALGNAGLVKTVLIDFGPFMSDYTNIQNNLDSFKSQMAAVIAQTAINGFDWDLESQNNQPYEPYHDLLVDLTQWANSIGCMVTAPPYEDQSFWNGVLEATNAGGAQGTSWWNLQLYSGVPNYAQWVRNFPTGLGLNAQSFQVPGYFTAGTPAGVQAQLAALYKQFPQIDGGFLWRYEDIPATGYSTAAWASALINAVGGIANDIP